MAFDFTGPFISEQEERQEKEGLSEKERKQLEADLFGAKYEPFPEMPMAIDHIYQVIEDAIQTIPDDDKKDYLAALKHCPDLVESECDPIAFLRREHFDVKAAAVRITRYWKCRRMTFGEHRAFLPMSLTGAMADDVHYYRKGFFQILPEDDQGRPVIFWDLVKSGMDEVPRDSLLRCFFYTLHILHHKMIRGMVFLFNARGYNLARHWDGVVIEQCIFFSRSIPLTAQAFHYIVRAEISVFNSIVLPVIKYLAGKTQRLRILTHAGSTDEEVCESLLSYGLRAENLKPVLQGADLKNTPFQSWIDEQLRESHGATVLWNPIAHSACGTCVSALPQT